MSNTSSPDPELTPEARRAINNYLIRYIKLISGAVGIVNGLFLLASLTYVFFVLPKNAAEQARASIAQRLQAETSETTHIIMGIVSKSSEAGVQTEQNTRRAKELTDKINSLQELLTTTSQTDAAKALVIAKELNGYPNASEVINKAAAIQTQLDSLQTELQTAPRSTISRDPRFNTQTDICPPGSYMIGIQYQIDQGVPHGITSHMKPVCSPLLPSNVVKQP